MPKHGDDQTKVGELINVTNPRKDCNQESASRLTIYQAELNGGKTEKSSLRLIIPEQEWLIKNNDAHSKNSEKLHKSDENKIQSVEADKISLRPEWKAPYMLQEGTHDTNNKLANHNEVCQQLRESEKSLQERNEDIRRKNDKIQSRLADLQVVKIDNLRLHDLVSEKEGDIRKLHERMRNASSKLANQDELCRRLRDSEKVLQQRNANLRRKDDKIQSLLADLRVAKMDNLRLHDLVSEKEGDIRKLHERMRNASSKLANQDELCRRLRDSEKTLQQHNADLRRENDEITLRLADLQVVEAGNLRLRDVVSEKESNIRKLQDETRNTRIERVKENEFCKQLRKSAKSLQQRNEDLQRENDRIQVLLADLQAVEVGNLRLRDFILETKSNICQLVDEMQKKTCVEIEKQNGICQHLRDSEKSLQERNNDLQQENDRIRTCLSEMGKEKSDLQKHIRALTSELSKLQCEKEPETSNTIEINKQLLKLTVDIDRVKSMAIRELKKPERIARESELEKIHSEYHQNIEHIRKCHLPIEDENFKLAVDKYRNACEETEGRMRSFMKKVYDIELFCKDTSRKEEIDAGSLDEELSKVDELKRTLFFDNFQREESLYKDILNVYFDTQILMGKLSGNSFLKPTNGLES